jgi:translocation and assembly module TamB
MKDATGMDYLEIKPNDVDNKGNSGVNVVVGKELSRQMMVKYGVDVRDGETVQRVTTDYKLLENLLMSGFQDTGGAFGGEIKYRLEFR